MSNPWSAELEALDLVSLSPIVQRVLDDPTAEVLNFSYKPLVGGLELANVLYRFTGQVRCQEQIVSWSLILKARALMESDQDPAGVRFWKREALAYQSGLLADLPGGLAAPRCYAVVEQPNGLWLWLEELRDEIGPDWPLEQYARVARHLGQFNGAYLAGKRSLPEVPWISRNWLRKYVEAAVPMVDFIRKNPKHLLVRSVYPGSARSLILMFWEARRPLLDFLESLPQTFCHQDAFRKNLFALPDCTVAVDWTYSGIAPLGAELAPLVGMAVGLWVVRADQYAAFDQSILAAYVEGLRQAGWDGNAKQVRQGFTWTFVLRYLYGASIGEMFKAFLSGVGMDQFTASMQRTSEELANTPADVAKYYQTKLMEGLKLVSLPLLVRILFRMGSYFLKR